jgi:16S rRNA (adenine1518-N6/adenine1519-N6)-dimethyltransferase
LISPRKHLGQNFLQDDNILRKIVASLELKLDDHVVEIGPGPGALTRLLADACRLTAVELDRRAVERLQEEFAGRVTIVEGDILKVSAGDLLTGTFHNEHVAFAAFSAGTARKAHGMSSGRGPLLRVVGNIPYYITSDILFWVLDQRDLISDATLMVQAEVAARLVAKPRTKEYGILSVFARYYAVPRRLFGVSRNCFYPRPDVDSAVVRLDLRHDLPEIDDVLFRTVVRGTFGKRRKTMRNGLGYAGIPKEIIAELGPVADRRPEELTPEEFVGLTKDIEARKSTFQAGKDSNRQ